MGGCSSSSVACTKAAAASSSSVQVICSKDVSLDACLDDGQDLADSHALVNHRLLRASQDGNVEQVQVCIQNGANLETRRPFAMSPDTGIELGAGNPGLTPLMYAAQNSSTDACEVLLLARACVNSKDEDAMRPLHFAACAGSRATCMLLLAQRADASAKDMDGRTAYDLLPTSELATALERKCWGALLGQEQVIQDCSAVVHDERKKVQLEGGLGGMARRPPPEPSALDGDPKSRWKPSAAATRTTTDWEVEALVVVSFDETPAAAVRWSQTVSRDAVAALPPSAAEAEGI